MTRSLSCAGIVLACAMGWIDALAAQGSNVMQHGACATALVSAGVASPCADGSAILFSPAALATVGTGVSAGVTAINTAMEFTYDLSGDVVTRDATTSPVPFGFANYSVDNRLAVGIGVFAPYGLGIDWPLDFEGRFVTYDTSLRNIYIQPTVAYRVAPRLRVGGGIDVVLGSIELNQRVDLADQIAVNPATGEPVINPATGQPARFSNFGVPSGTDFADARLAGSGTGFTFNVSAIAEISDQLSFGIRYLHPVKIDYDGDARFRQVPTNLTLGTGNPLGLPGGTPVDGLVAGQFADGAALANQDLSTSLTFPSQLVLGVAVRPTDALKLLVDYQYTGWDSFDTAHLDFADAGPDTDLLLDYRNTHTWLLGAEYMAEEDIALRAGFRFNTAAERDASVSPLLPEAERNYYSLGIGYAVTDGLHVDLGYQLVDQSDRRGRTRNRTSLDQTADDVNVGVYSSDAHVFSLSIAYGFGARR